MGRCDEIENDRERRENEKQYLCGGSRAAGGCCCYCEMLCHGRVFCECTALLRCALRARALRAQGIACAGLATQGLALQHTTYKIQLASMHSDTHAPTHSGEPNNKSKNKLWMGIKDSIAGTLSGAACLFTGYVEERTREGKGKKKR